ncbi:MAG: FAD-dependent oxidoreductase, partial [Armatimonadetes bacterium]|nr:FAD-dependent oxidoreductase [Armatimonadota bacterium]
MIIGGGLAGLSAACALAERGLGVTLYESRRQVGGRAASFTPPGHGAPVDFCQHVLMRCCTNLLDFYGRIGVLDRVAFRPRLTFLDREGRLSSLGASALPAPLHLAPSLLRLKFLGPRDKLAIARAFAAMLREIGDGGPETGDAGDGGPETGDRPAASCVLHPASCVLPPAP